MHVGIMNVMKVIPYWLDKGIIVARYIRECNYSPMTWVLLRKTKSKGMKVYVEVDNIIQL